MPLPLYPDISTRAELLTYLVTSQLIARHLTGKWLTVHDVVESTHLWMRTNGREFDVLHRVSLVSRAEGLAAHIARIGRNSFDAKTLRRAFLDHVNLNYQSPAVIEIYSNCVAMIVFETRFTGSRPPPDGQ